MNNETMMRDQWLSCCTNELSEEFLTLVSSWTPRLRSSSYWVTCEASCGGSDQLVSILRLRSQVQDRDELNWSYLARYCGSVQADPAVQL